MSEKSRLGIDCEVDVGEESSGYRLRSGCRRRLPRTHSGEHIRSSCTNVGIVQRGISPDWDPRHKFPQRLCIGTSSVLSSSSAHRLPAAAFAFSCPWSSLRWSLFYCSCSRSNPVALPSYCDPGLVAALLELLPEGSRIAPHFGALSAPTRSSVGRSRALTLGFSTPQYHPTSVDRVAGTTAGMEDASASGLTRQLGALEVSDSPCTVGELSDDLDYLTATAREADLDTEASSYFSAVEVEEQIEQSKVHWSLLSLESPGSAEGEEEVAEVSNARVFKDLQAHPSWGLFFRRQDECAEFVVGKRFAAGAQAELYHVQLTSHDPEWNEYIQKYGVEWVLKVFRKGTFLRDLQLQVPTGYLDYRAQLWNMDATLFPPRFQSSVVSGILLDDGRFAFLMEKEHFDLQHVIERNMKSRGSKGMGPFSKEEVELIMYRVALGMDWLHSHNIIHRDLKASNVLVKEFKSTIPRYMCYVADYECSVGVIGTGFFRAPEILQACKDRKLNERLEVFSKASDVYGYGMVCYEALTGKLPFEGHRTNDYDLVLNGGRPMLPGYVEGWTCELLNRCWQSNPRDRPSFGEILDLLLANSRRIRARDEYTKAHWGKNYRTWGHIENLV